MLFALLAVLLLSGAEVDVASARAVFERNLEAIRQRDRDAYLQCYWRSDDLVRSSPGGPQLGWEGLAATAGEGWPDAFDAQDLRLSRVAEGVVYGTYRYRVRYGDEEQTGLSERVFLRTARGWKIAVTTAFPAPPGTPPPDLALLGATLVDGTGRPGVPDAAVVLRDGKVACAGPKAACPVPEGASVIDAQGAWITPGLIDTHVHFSQTGWVDGRPDAIDVRERHPYEQVVARLKDHPERFLRADLCSGVTAVFDVGGYPWSLALPRRAEADTRAPHVVASGPLLSTTEHWLNLPAERQFLYLSDPAAAASAASYLKAQGSAAVKLWLIEAQGRSEAELEAVALAAGEQARAVGLPLVAHATSLRAAKLALRAGARLLVHSVDDQPVDAEFLDLARKKDVLYCPTLTVIRGYQRLLEDATAHRAPTIDDPNGCIDAGTRELLAQTANLPLPASAATRSERWAARAQTASANLKRVRDAGIRVVLGTDAGNPLTLHGPSVYAELEAMQAAGLAAEEVVLAATRDAARALGREKDLGTLEPGKAADLLVLDADPTRDVAAFRRLRLVVRGGEARALAELRAPAP